jgi:hypothetical protein
VAPVLLAEEREIQLGESVVSKITFGLCRNISVRFRREKIVRGELASILLSNSVSGPFTCFLVTNVDIDTFIVVIVTT